jgi:hypothetical protein
LIVFAVLPLGLVLACLTPSIVQVFHVFDRDGNDGLRKEFNQTEFIAKQRKLLDKLMKGTFVQIVFAHRC